MYDFYPDWGPARLAERQDSGRFGNQRGDRQDRGDRQGQDRGDRQGQDRGDRQGQDRGDRQGRERFPRGDRQDFQRSDVPRQDGPRQDGQRQDREPRRERRPDGGDEQQGGLPAFLTTPVRAPINAEDGGSETAAPANAEFSGDEGAGEPNGRYGTRPRRRRRSRYGNGAGEEGAPEQGSDFAPEGVEPPAE